MIEIALQDVEMDFGFKKILKGVSFVVKTGEKAALVGGNGSGKTTLMRIIMGLQKCDKGFCTIRKGATLGYLDQSSDITDRDITVEGFIKEAQQAAFAIEGKLRDVEKRMALPKNESKLDKLLSEYDRLQNDFIAIGGYELEENFNKICNAFKIGNDMRLQKCVQLSGGQKTIVKLAKVLLQHPDILLLDEPTNHIDIETLKWLEDFIQNYRGTVLVISHDRYFIDKTATGTILLDQGKAEIYHGNYSFCLQEQERQDMLEFEQYKNQQKKIEAMKAAIKRFREWGERGDNPRLFKKAANMEKQLERMELIDKPQADRKLPIHFEAGRRSGKRVLTIRDLHFAYKDFPLFEGANMEMLFQERVCLLGANGTGKSTLIKLILKEILPEDGTISIAESAKTGYIPQEVSFEDESVSILTAFREDVLVHENEARRRLAKFFITGDEVHKRLHSLSGGERVILKLAMIMQRPVNLLILDEPTNHLDINTKELLEESLSDYQGSLLFISHDRYFINRLATKIVYIETRGLKSVEGNFEDYLGYIQSVSK